MQEKVGEQGRLISPCLKAGALRHILVTGINAEAHRLLRFAAGSREPNGEGRPPRHCCFLLFQENARLCRRTRHQGLPPHVQNKYSQVLSPRPEGR